MTDEFRRVLREMEAGALSVQQALDSFRVAPPSVSPTFQEDLTGSSTARDTERRVLLRPLATFVRPLPGVQEARPVRLKPTPAPETAPSPPSLLPSPLTSDRTGDPVRILRTVPGVALLAMEDREQRNMFSGSLVTGLHRGLKELSSDPEIKVVVVHGFDTWFCSGGTPEQLQRIRTGESHFSDDPIYRALLDFELPTVAAMQGHALGGGMTFGLYADVIVMAEEAYYAGNFMQHGFTPGVGATALFPARLGDSLGREMLCTATRYQGRELQARGAGMLFRPAADVIPTAVERARELAEHPRNHLLVLKRLLNRQLKQRVDEAIDFELAAHEELFEPTKKR